MFIFLKKLTSKKTSKSAVEKTNKKERIAKKMKNFTKLFGRMLFKIIKIIPSIAAVAASIATCITVIEMRNERNQLYKPQMIFESSYFSDNYKRIFWDTRDARNLIITIDDEDEFPALETTIYNLGSGAALDLKISFILDNYEKFIEEITSYYVYNNVEINDNDFKISIDGKTFKYSASYEDFLIKKPFLLSGESMNVVIPNEFCKLLYCLNVCTNGDYTWEPTIHLQMSYSDLQGNTYFNDYELLIKTEISYFEQGEKYLHVDYSVEQGYYELEWNNSSKEEKDEDT